MMISAGTSGGLSFEHCSQAIRLAVLLKRERGETGKAVMGIPELHRDGEFVVGVIRLGYVDK